MVIAVGNTISARMRNLVSADSEFVSHPLTSTRLKVDAELGGDKTATSVVQSRAPLEYRTEFKYFILNGSRNQCWCKMVSLTAPD